VGPLGFPELIVIFVIALLVFGPKRLPELGRTFGKAMNEFRRASNELRSVVEEEVREFERQTADVKHKVEEAVTYPDDMHTSAPAPQISAAPEQTEQATPPGTTPASVPQTEENETPAHGQPGNV